MLVGRCIAFISTVQVLVVMCMRCKPMLNILTLKPLELTATCMQRPCCADTGVNASSAAAKAIKIYMICSIDVCQASDLAWPIIPHPAGSHLKSEIMHGQSLPRKWEVLAILCSSW